MDVVEAVVHLAKERDVYESWFESLVGKHVTLRSTQKKKTHFYDCVVTEFVEGEGWEIESDEGDFFTITFDDFVNGSVYLTPDVKRTVHFQ